MKKILVAIALFLFTGTGMADGSVNFQKTIVPILEAQPLLAELVTEPFTVTGSLMGVRIGGRMASELGGARIGPYRVHVFWHSPKGNIAAILVVNTTPTFYDKAGHALGGDIANAVRVSEVVNSISLERPVDAFP